MPQTGKIPREFFHSQIAPRLGADRSDVRIGPKHGVDFGVIDVDGTALAVATDPVSILPDLGFERAGRFAVRIVLADVAVSGLSPSHLAISFSLPPELTDDEFATVWGAIHDECTDLGVDIVTGHTARYEGCSFPWVGGATAMAVGDHDEIIRPDGSRPGDDLVLTTGPAVEAASLFASLFPEQIDCEQSVVDRVAVRLDDLDGVRDALAAADASGVTAVHDVTEGGLLGALHEMAAGAGVQFSVGSEHVPTDPDVLRLCDALGMEPWTATSSGSLLVAVDSASTDAVLSRLRGRGTTAAVIGGVEAGSGVIRDGERTRPPAGDSSWPVYEALLEADS
ncbi:AIR synthase family protein [Halohasta litorea]|uniref:AIR synthase family protein n=1 Tax=Halohasta litorea TaxID=869891 RepID=A0ABD6D5I6_9EURY|nr:AIR synthase family protein [Halohasta litorea]